MSRCCTLQSLTPAPIPKGLEMVRNIYGELYKTTDYRDRLDIEKYAIQSESVRRRKAFVEAASWIPDLNAVTDDLDRNNWFLNVENGTLSWERSYRKVACSKELSSR